MTKETIYSIIEQGKKGETLSRVYDIFMIVVVLISIVPLMCLEHYRIFDTIEIATTVIFIIDYLLRLYTADLKLKKGLLSYVIYPFTPMAIIDLLSILPGLNVLNKAFKIFRITRLFKIFRLIKLFRYSKRIIAFGRVLKKERNSLLTVLCMAIFYIFVTALIMFNIEPSINPYTNERTFSSFFDALYWATVTLTTVGYGDMCPVTAAGRMVSMLSSIFGIAIIALPSGIVTASYIDELKEMDKKDK